VLDDLAVRLDEDLDERRQARAVPSEARQPHVESDRLV
jgi:hypothetical protein